MVLSEAEAQAQDGEQSRTMNFRPYEEIDFW